LTQDLLQSLLELNLSDDAAERFWEHYEGALASGLLQQDAFLSALELALGEEDQEEDTTVMRNRPNIRHGVPLQSARTHITESWEADPTEVIEEEEEIPRQEVNMNRKQGDDSIKMKSGRGRRWAPLTSVSGLATSSSSASNVKASTEGALPKACERPRAESSSTSVAEERPSKAVAEHAPPKENHSRTGTIEVVEQRVEAWLEQALLQFMERDAVAAIIAGVEVVLDCSADVDAASNAADLLADELPPGSVLGEEVLQEFKRRVATRR